MEHEDEDFCYIAEDCLNVFFEKMDETITNLASTFSKKQMSAMTGDEKI